MRMIAALAAVLSLVAAWLLLPQLETANAAPVMWDLSMNGASKTMAGDKFKFSGQGTMSWDTVTGDVSFNLNTDAGPWTGTGTLAVAQNGKTVYGLVNFLAGGESAVAVFSGKLKKKGAKLVGKYQAASPARLGPTPGGFVLTTGKMGGSIQN